MQRAVVVGLVVGGLAACASTAPPSVRSRPAAVAAVGAPATPAASAPPAVAAPAAPRYLAMFEDLVQRIERDHTFPPGYERDVGHPWRDDIPRLRDEFARAADRDQALIALRHLQVSLRDVHCSIDPPADRPRQQLRLGVELWAGGSAAQPELRIARVLDRELAGIAVGDVVTAVDGAPLAAWLAAHPFESFYLAPDRAASETLLSITRADLPWSAVRPGDTRVLTIVHDGAARDVALGFRLEQRSRPEPSLDDPPAMASIDCGPIDYGDYAPSDVGINYCVYTPRARKPRIPIVRYRSFVYQVPDSAQTLRIVKADHDGLARALRGADGVILDLHENGGGNNPFLFLGWFSAGRFDHPRVVARVDPKLDDDIVLHLLSPVAAAHYLTAQREGGATISWPFLCAHEPCTQVAAAASEQVTRAPVALVVGPSCASSCDTLALTWSAFHLGPVVGKQPVHGYTVVRLAVAPAAPDREDLGQLRLALSHSELRDGLSIEGEPLALDWQAPDRFESRTSWVKDAVREATARLAHAAR